MIPAEPSALPACSLANLEAGLLDCDPVSWRIAPNPGQRVRPQTPRRTVEEGSVREQFRPEILMDPARPGPHETTNESIIRFARPHNSASWYGPHISLQRPKRPLVSSLHLYARRNLGRKPVVSQREHP